MTDDRWSMVVVGISNLFLASVILFNILESHSCAVGILLSCGLLTANSNLCNDFGHREPRKN